MEFTLVITYYNKIFEAFYQANCKQRRILLPFKKIFITMKKRRLLWKKFLVQSWTMTKR